MHCVCISRAIYFSGEYTCDCHMSDTSLRALNIKVTAR